MGGDVVKLTLSKVGVSVIMLLIGMLLSRFRTLEEYGTYSQMTLVINLATTLFMLGLPNSLNYFLAKADTDLERKRFLSVYYTLSTALSLLLGSVLVAVTPLLVRYFDNPLLKTFWFYLALFPFTKIIGASIENILVVYRRANNIILFRIANSLSILGSILFVEFMHWDFSTYLKIYLGVEVVFALAVYGMVYRLAKGLRFSLNFPLIKKIFAFSIPIGLASVVGTLNIELDKLMIGNLLDTEQLAIYTNAAREMPVTLITSSVTAVLLPQMVRILKSGKKEDNENAIHLWGSAIEITFSCMCFFAITLFVFAPEVITILYSEKYLPGVRVFRVYSLCLLIRCTYWGMVLNAKGKTNFILFSSLASLALNTVLNYLFYMFWGMIGPAIATLLSQLVISIAQLVFTARILKIKLSRVFPWATMGRVILRTVALGCGIYAVKEFIVTDTLFSAWWGIDSYTGKAIEAIMLGIVWVGIWLAIELRNIKRNWGHLNNMERKMKEG